MITGIVELEGTVQGDGWLDGDVVVSVVIERDSGVLHDGMENEVEYEVENEMGSAMEMAWKMAVSTVQRT